MVKTPKSKTKMRGGFMQPPPPAFMRGVKKVVTPQNVGAFIKFAAGNGPQAEAWIKRSMKHVSNARMTTEMAGKVLDVVSEGFVREGETEAIAETTNQIRGNSNPSSTVGKAYKTKFVVGQPPTASVNREARANGTTKLVSSDSQTSPSGPFREALTIRTGFNQKRVACFHTPSYWTMDDLADLVNADSFDRKVGAYQSAYWLTKMFGVKYSIMNRNRYLKMKVKIHMVSQRKVDYAAYEWFGDAFTATLPDALETNVQSIPYNSQLTPRSVTTFRTDCGIDPVMGSITKSKIFNECFDIQKTFSKWLDPGELWDFDYQHMTGPGLKLNNILVQNDSFSFAEDAAAFYFPIFEIVGSRVECYDSENGLESFIGTSSGAVQIEMRKHCEIVESPKNVDTIYDTNDGFTDQKWAYRVFTDSAMGPETGLISRRFNVNYDDIQLPSTNPAAGKYVIPVTTDQSIVRGGKINLPT